VYARRRERDDARTVRTIVSRTNDEANEMFSVRAHAETASQNHRQNQVFSLSRDRRARCMMHRFIRTAR
jgi:hypothetical protein